MSGIGSFSPEAYEQLQQAYASQLARADEIEEAGVKVGADTLGVETVPIKSDWLDRTGLWKYPDGRGEHMDVKQKQQDLLAALRNEDGEVEIPVDDEEPSLDEMTNEQVDQMIDEILADLDDSDDSDEIDNTLDSVLTDVDIDEESSDSSIDEMTDEELDAYIDQLIGESEPTAEDIAIRIEELKAQLSALTESDEDTEDTEEPEEPEETQGEEDETESELPPEDEE